MLVGEDLQILLTATFSDGSTRDVTTSDTTYIDTYTDPEKEVLRIEEGGRIIALASGTRLISVRYGWKLNLGMARLDVTVVDPMDTDGDGVTNNVELAHGLDPNFSDDATLDFDDDLLNNRDEIKIGTDLRDPDTDGDRLSDGVEVHQGTDPLVPETTLGGRSSLLNEHCVVSALNRTAPVNAEGVWVLPNVPASFGQVRVRATCDEDGVTRSGQSSFFTVPVARTVQVPEIRFDAPEPIPERLELTTDASTLTTPGQTLAVTTRAILPGGEPQDVTSQASGTSYTVSNPTVARIDENGLVTAQVSGRVLISASNDGALGMLELRVTLSADSDGDGLPDDFELANGLDPNQPLDAFLDADGDGLTVVDEFTLGLDPKNPDTDGDTLLDGDELALGTDPLLFDSDGDGVSDGLELRAESDPRDDASVNLPPILASLEVAPRSLTISFDVVLSEASRTVNVVGTLIDGTVLDITGAPYGTQYTSSDLSIASFGVEPGRIFAGQDGVAIVSASNGSFTDTSEVTVESFSPVALSFLPLPGFANNVVADDTYAFVAAGEAGLHVVDVSELEHPVLVATLDTPGNANDVELKDDRLYIADGAAGLMIVDVSLPMTPQFVGSVDTPGDALAVVVRDGTAYVADGGAGLTLVDVSDPAQPLFLAGASVPVAARGVDVIGELALVADTWYGLLIFDVSDPTSPVLIGETRTRPPFDYSRAADVVARGALAYVADGGRGLGGLRVVDFQDPRSPVMIGSTSDALGLVAVALDEDFVLAADYFFRNGVPIFDVSTERPVFNALLDFSGPPSNRADNGTGIAVREGVVFLTGGLGDQVMGAFGAVGDTGLHIGRYRAERDDRGIAPMARLLSPVEGTTAIERTVVTLQAEASDDVRVRFVEFFVDGEPVGRDHTPPYEHALRLPRGATRLELVARAVDLADREGFSPPTELEVQADTAPTVELISPRAASRIIEGLTLPFLARASDDLAVAWVELLVDGEVVARLEEEPYRFDHAVLFGRSSVVVEARAADSEGQSSTAGPVTVQVDADDPPLVVLLEPVPEEPVVFGGQLEVVIGASDDIAVDRVELYLNSEWVAERGELPYVFSVTVPTTGSQLHLLAVAHDIAGQTSRVESLLPIIGDPLTIMRGRVTREDGSPIVAATVICGDLSVSDSGATRMGTSGVAGDFAIADVPTAAGVVACSADWTSPQGVVFAGSSEEIAPSRGGETDVGTLVLMEQAVAEEHGRPLGLGRGGSTLVELPFAFPFFDQLYDRVHVNADGTLTFGGPHPDSGREDVAELLSGESTANGHVGPLIAAFWDDLDATRREVRGGIDIFHFYGNEDDLFVELRPLVAGSPLDPVLTLYDGRGRICERARDRFLAASLISVLPHHLRVEDALGAGGPELAYELQIYSYDEDGLGTVVEGEPNNDFASATFLEIGQTVLASSKNARIPMSATFLSTTPSTVAWSSPGTACPRKRAI